MFRRLGDLTLQDVKITCMHITDFPLAAHPGRLLVVFVALLVVFDLILVRWLKLGAPAWKRADYVWLCSAAVGLIGTSMDARRVLAEAAIDNRRVDRERTYAEVLYNVNFMTGPAVCRTFTKPEYSPSNFAEIQAEYDAVCKFARESVDLLRPRPPETLADFHMASRPSTTDDVLLDTFKDLDRALIAYRTADSEYHRTVVMATRGGSDLALTVISPILVAFALALRITKVTGELAEERARALKEAVTADARRVTSSQTELTEVREKSESDESNEMGT
jgi:hypothetical protein